ncbi:MAG: CDP-alcohol phosphatidyltransferase family protein [Patescibacteria group bacterium]
MRDPARPYPHDHVLAATVLRLFPQRVTPNQITWFRFLTTPVVLLLLIAENYRWGVPAFILVAFTDALDGSLARTRKQVTEWGTIYDPVADKILVGSVVVLVVLRHLLPAVGVVMLALEVLFLLGGWYRKRNGQTLGANVWGKTKMFLQVIAVSLLLISVWFSIPFLVTASLVVFGVSVVFAVASLVTYGF